MARMPSQPIALNARVWRTASAVVVAATPATTGARPLAAQTTVSTMTRFCSPSVGELTRQPSGVSPCTPA